MFHNLDVAMGFAQANPNTALINASHLSKKLGVSKVYHDNNDHGNNNSINNHSDNINSISSNNSTSIPSNDDHNVCAGLVMMRHHRASLGSPEQSVPAVYNCCHCCA